MSDTSISNETIAHIAGQIAAGLMLHPDFGPSEATCDRAVELAQAIVARVNAPALASGSPCMCGTGPCIRPAELLDGFVCVREAGIAVLAAAAVPASAATVTTSQPAPAPVQEVSGA